MKLIVGLGNPGTRYAASRHNVGFMVVKALARRHHIKLAKGTRISTLCGTGSIDGSAVALALPLTFMNLSGEAAARLVDALGLPRSHVLVVCDDVDLALGELRLRRQGSSGGHRGLRSVIEAFGSQEFARLRIGVGRPLSGELPVAEYVLSTFTRREMPVVRQAVDEAAGCCETWLSNGIEKSMSMCNRRSKQE